MRTRLIRTGAWLGAGALVVLAARAIAYALSPSPLAAHFEHAAGGPALPAVALVSLLLGVACSAAVVWLAALGVRERRVLSGEPRAAEPRLALARAAVRAVALFACTSAAFALVESTLHWRAGLGWHGLHCLTGPTHRNAIPVLGALSLVAAALAAALEHVLGWMRRTVAGIRAASAHVLRPVVPFDAISPGRLAGRALGSVRARGPPLAAM